MSDQMFTDGLFLGFLLGILFSVLAYKFVLKGQGRSRKKEIDILVQQFQEHFRQLKGGKGEPEDSS
ncbi:MAG: hypothetical protein D6736_11650 [Nitrospinota bacterium]|nr:MAG: hypothetical protein D6736_11650 [Nitrospinota bacterium]